MSTTTELNRGLTAERLLELLVYDLESGVFRWRVSTNRRITVGNVAGWIDVVGYWRIRIDGHWYYAHRLAWFYTSGKWPPTQIDHMDGDKQNNRLSNLRLASSTQNHANSYGYSASGFKGVQFHA